MLRYFPSTDETSSTSRLFMCTDVKVSFENCDSSTKGPTTVRRESEIHDDRLHDWRRHRGRELDDEFVGSAVENVRNHSFREERTRHRHVRSYVRQISDRSSERGNERTNEKTFPLRSGLHMAW